MTKILLVEDNDINRDMLSRRLERKGYEVIVAINGVEGVTKTRSDQPDLVLMDLHLPVLDGWEATRQIKANPKTRVIPVIALTADAISARGANSEGHSAECNSEGTVGEREKAIAAGCDEYEIKPIDFPRLLKKIAKLLEPPAPQPAALLPSENLNSPLDAGRTIDTDELNAAALGQPMILWENAPIGVYQATVEGRFRRVNPALVRLLGYPDAGTLMEAIASIADQIYVDSSRYADLRCLLEENDQVTGFEYQAYRHDGEMIWIAEHAHAVRDASGQLIYYEGIVEEITQRKLDQAFLNQQLEALQLELEQLKRGQQAAAIVQTDYFQQLQSNATQDTQLPVAFPLKVLLVEDNELNCDMLSRRLKRHGYEVVIANDGADGVSKALAEQPHIILMDISLPVMDGWEATQQLKANPKTCRIPVIALTAHAMTGDCEKALAAGCDDYDTKPIDLPRLLSKLERCLKHLASNDN